jgi:hypothetical protein
MVEQQLKAETKGMRNWGSLGGRRRERLGYPEALDDACDDRKISCEAAGVVSRGSSHDEPRPAGGEVDLHLVNGDAGVGLPGVVAIIPESGVIFAGPMATIAR